MVCAQIESNDSWNDERDGIPPLGIRVSVVGGEHDAIGEVIYAYRSIAYETVGNNSVMVLDCSICDVEIRFNWRKL